MNENLKKIADKAGFMKFRNGNFTEEAAIQIYTQTIIEKCAYILNVEDQKKRKELEQKLIEEIM